MSNNFFFFFLHRITSRFPDDPRQPFWNETGAPMKPLAKLSLTRQRLYRKSCIKDNDIAFQETIVPSDLYEDHHGGMYLLYCKLLWRILSRRHTFCIIQCDKNLRVKNLYTNLVSFLKLYLKKYNVKPLRYVSKNSPSIKYFLNRSTIFPF